MGHFPPGAAGEELETGQAAKGRTELGQGISSASVCGLQPPARVTGVSVPAVSGTWCLTCANRGLLSDFCQFIGFRTIANGVFFSSLAHRCQNRIF